MTWPPPPPPSYVNVSFSCEKKKKECSCHRNISCFFGCRRRNGSCSCHHPSVYPARRRRRRRHFPFLIACWTSAFFLICFLFSFTLSCSQTHQAAHKVSFILLPSNQGHFLISFELTELRSAHRRKFLDPSDGRQKEDRFSLLSHPTDTLSFWIIFGLEQNNKIHRRCFIPKDYLSILNTNKKGKNQTNQQTKTKEVHHHETNIASNIPTLSGFGDGHMDAIGIACLGITLVTDTIYCHHHNFFINNAPWRYDQS